MTNRQKSRIAFTYAVATAVPVTGIVLYSLIADWSRSQTLLLLIGSLIVVWAIVFSFLEVGAIAARSKNITDPDEVVDPDAPRRVMVAPPTGEPYPHHEHHVGSAGLDQGQLTSRLPDHTPSLGSLLRGARPKKHAG
jgi:hypothetical protein